MKILKVLSVAVCALSFANVINAGERMVLSDGGKARAAVVVAADASAPVKHAAAQLANYLNQISGAEFQVVNDAPAGTTRLLVGPGAARLADANFSAEGLGREGLVIRTVGNDLIIAGGEPRGTLYAVYTFLDDVLGCRWWSTGVSTIPKKQTIEIGALDVRYIPPMHFRAPLWLEAANGDWAVRNKSNSNHAILDEAHGGQYQILDFVHTFYKLLPPEQYFSSHPEWYSEIDGKRTHERAQLCLTNVEMQQEMIRVVKERLRANPNVSETSISQQDWEGYCRCASCAALDKAEGDTPAGSMIHFINAIAEGIEEEFPNVRISTLAYDYSQKPPAHVRPRDNVVIWLCSTGTSFAHPITNEHNAVFRERLETWSNVTDNIVIWDYVTNFANYVSPHANLRAIGPNIQFFADHHVTGVLSQGAYSGEGAEFSELRAWVITRMLWNPKLDAGALIDEFIAGFYGPAGPEIKAYIDVMHDAIAQSDETLEMTSPPLGEWLSIRPLAEGLAHLRKAERAAGGDAALRQRVKVAQLPVIYVFLMRWDELKAQAAAENIRWPFERPIQEVYQDFLATAAERGITQWSESNARDAFQSVAERVAMKDGIPPPPRCEKLPRGAWVDVQDSSFNRKDMPLATLYSDETASDGQAAFMPGDHDVPAVQKQLWRIFLVHAAQHRGKKLRCYASVRCEFTQPEGIALTCGITGDTEGVNIFKTEVNAADLSDGKYHTIDLGAYDDLRGWKSVWFAPVKNANVKSIWIDRIWLVEE